MSKIIKMIIGALLILVIMFCSINVCQDIGRSLKLDITNQRLYTLSGGTRAILAKLHQPVTVKLFYAKNGRESS